jgi:hypothetical protein
MKILAAPIFCPLTNPQPYQRDRDKPRQGVVANTLKLHRNGAVGFIGWLDGWRDIINSLDELRLNPDGVMTVVWRLRAVIEDVQL